MKSNLTGKKIFFIIFLALALVSCGANGELSDNTSSDEIQYENYIVGGNSMQSRVLEGNILSNNSIKKISSISGKVTGLNCEAGNKVYTKSLIVTISPDFSDPNIKGLITTRNSLQMQLGNLEGIKLSTINNLDTQISTLLSNIDSTTKQLDLTKQNYDMLIEQKGLTSSDLNTQVDNLEEQLTNLNKQKYLLEKSKNEELDKLNTSIKNIESTSYNTISDILLYIDELYGITEENKDKNNSYEDYLSARDNSIKNQVKVDFSSLNNIDYKNLSGEELSDYESKLNDLIKLAYNGVKKSIENISFSESVISGHYSTLLGYSNGLLTLKTNLDSAIESKPSISNTYDTQIAALVTSIDSLSGSIDNLKNNKSESTLLGLDVNLKNLESQINSLENSLTTLNNNLDGLKENKNITIKQLDNQVLSLKQNIDSLNINLAPQEIYAGINGSISNNYTSLNATVGAGTPICEILSDGEDSLKLRVSSAVKLIDGYIYSVESSENVLFTGSLLTLLPNKDSMTQNYIYETILNQDNDLKVGDKLKVLIDYPNKDKDIQTINDEIIEIPIEYVTPRLDGYFIKEKTSSGDIVEKSVKVGEVNLPDIQILEGVELGDNLVK